MTRRGFFGLVAALGLLTAAGCEETDDRRMRAAYSEPGSALKWTLLETGHDTGEHFVLALSFASSGLFIEGIESTETCRVSQDFGISEMRLSTQAAPFEFCRAVVERVTQRSVLVPWMPRNREKTD